MNALQCHIRRLMCHWLWLANVSSALFLALPFIAPFLLKQGQVDLANAIYAMYSVTCHEWPFRSYFLFGSQATYSIAELRSMGIESIYDLRGARDIGYKVAFCQRNVAIYLAVLVAGLAYGHLGTRVRPLSFRTFCVLASPMALDGVSQLFGWRESTWELRTLTGGLFGLASVWLIFPRADAAVGMWLREDRLHTRMSAATMPSRLPTPQ